MKQFKNTDSFCSWVELVPECKESAGKKLSTKIRKGNKYLKAVIVGCTRSAIRKKEIFFYARYQKIAARRGGKRVLIAITHSMAIAIYHILKELQPFKDLGNTYYTEQNAKK